MRKIDYSRLAISLSRTMGRYPSNITRTQFVKEVASKLTINKKEAQRLFEHYVYTGVLEATSSNRFCWKRHQDFFTIESVRKTVDEYGIRSHFGRIPGVSPHKKEDPSKEQSAVEQECEVLEPEVIDEPAPLKEFTTEQLRDELVRRGWHITLS